MLAQYTKNVLVYAAILAAGLGVGWAAPRAYQYLKPAYTEGDYSLHYAGTGGNVVVYGTPTCPYCAKTRAYLRSHHIAFADLDITQGGRANQNFAALRSQSVPVILVGSRRINGYNESALADALQAAGHAVAR